MIIMNEKKYAEDIINGGELKNGFDYTLVVIGKYYKYNGLNSSQIKNKLEEFVSKYKPDISDRQRDKMISKHINNLEKYSSQLAEVLEIVITKPEIEKINSIKPHKYKAHNIKKLAFTLLCLAKFRVAKGKQPIVYMDYGKIFKHADIHTSKTTRGLYLRELIDNGLIERATTRVDGTALRILFIEDGKKAVSVTDLNQAGKFYDQYCGVRFTTCERCDKMIKKTNNRMKYCPDCAAVINRQKTLERMRAAREETQS